LLVALTAPAAAAERREIRTSIRDPYGQPIQGAGLYVEVAVGAGQVIGFDFALADASGEVALRVAWRADARLGCLALAPGRRPHAFSARPGVGGGALIEFVLQEFDPSYPGPDDWLLRIGFPFEGDRALAEKAVEARFEPLRRLLTRFGRSLAEPAFVLEEGTVRTGGFRPRLFLSAGGERLACAYQRERDERWFVSLQGQLHEAHQGVLDVVLASQGERWAYSFWREVGSWRRKELRAFVRAGPDTFGPFESVVKLGLSPDGGRLWFVAREPDGTWRVWLDGEPRGEPVGELDASPDGTFMAAVVRRAGQLFVLLNGREHGGYDEVLRPPSRSPDGAHVWFQFRRAGRVHHHLDGRELEGCEQGGALTLLPGGEGTWFWCQDGGRRRLMIDGRPGPELPEGCWPLLGPGGVLAGRLQKRGELWDLELKDRSLTGLEQLLASAFSPDGARVSLAYSRPSGTFIDLGGRVFGVPREEADAWGQVALSPEGARGAIAFSRQGQAFVRLEDRTLAVGEHVSELGFSPDGKVFWAVFYVMREGRRRYSLSLGGQVHGEYEFVTSPVFSPDGRHVRFGFQEGEEFIQVDHQAYRVASCLDGRFLVTDEPGGRWAFSYVQDYPDDARRHIHLDGRPAVRALLPEADQMSFQPHALVLRPGGGAVLASLDARGRVLREVLEPAAAPDGPGAEPGLVLEMPRREFSWGEPIPLRLSLSNPTGRTLLREDPLRTPKVRLLVRRPGDGKAFVLTLGEQVIRAHWNGRGPYPVPALELLPGAGWAHELDLLARLLAEPAQARELRPTAGWYTCQLQDRERLSEPLAFRVRFTRESFPRLIALTRDPAGEPRVREWAAAWLRALIEPHVRGGFTEPPWECVDPAAQARAELRFAKELDLHERWWSRLTPEAAERVLRHVHE
jgi:hypothetical protein